MNSQINLFNNRCHQTGWNLFCYFYGPIKFSGSHVMMSHDRLMLLFLLTNEDRDYYF